MTRAAGWFLLVAVVAVLLAAGSGVVLLPGMRALLHEGAGASAAFRSSDSATAHRWLGLLAAATCLPVAATGLLLGLHGLLAAHGPRVRAALLGALAPLLLAFALGAVFTGHGAWDRTHMSELQVGVVEAYLRLHGAVFGGGLLGAVALFGVALLWLRRAAEREDED